MGSSRLARLCLRGEAARNRALSTPERTKAELAKSKYASGLGEIPVLTWGSSWWKRIVEVFCLAGEPDARHQVHRSRSTKARHRLIARQKSGDFQAKRPGVGWGTVDPDEYIGEILSTQGLAQFLRLHSNPKLNELLEQGRAELDLASPRRRSTNPGGESIAVEEAASPALLLLRHPQSDDDACSRASSSSPLQLRRPVRQHQDGVTPPRLGRR